MGRMRLIQHKKEAYWFYSVLSRMYDKFVNPLFWTVPMREAALDLARLELGGLEVVDVGAGTGFTTAGIVARAPDAQVTMIDQSPHQLARSRARLALSACERIIGDAEELPFADESFDRWISAGSIEYWPEPQRAMIEAHRVLKPGGRALLIGPLRPHHPVARRLADTWMLFPEEHEYREWMEKAGFHDLESRILPAPWETESNSRYAIAFAGTKTPQSSPAMLMGAKREHADEPMTPVRAARFAVRFGIGSLAGAAFVPIGVVLMLRSKLRERA